MIDRVCRYILCGAVARHHHEGALDVFHSHRHSAATAYVRDRIAQQSIGRHDRLALANQAVHWNVKGPSFISLHLLFDDVAGEIDEFADTIAERITARRRSGRDPTGSRQAQQAEGLPAASENGQGTC